MSQVTKESAETETAKVGEKRDAETAGIAPATSADSGKKPRRQSANKAPPLGEFVAQEVCEDHNLDKFKAKLLDFGESDKARSEYESFVNGLNFERDPSKVETVTCGDILHLVPAIKSNKRSFAQLYELDAKIRDLYVDARRGYEAVELKALKLKVKDYGRQLTAEQKRKREEQKEEATAAAAAAVAAESVANTAVAAAPVVSAETPKK